MGAEKRLQRKLNRMGKKKGNSVDVNDGEVEVTEFIQDHGTKGQKRRATRLYEKINKGSGILMTSPLNKGDRTGDSVSWKYGDGTYSGTCINASCSRARTENGKVKYLPKNKKK